MWPIQSYSFVIVLVDSVVWSSIIKIFIKLFKIIFNISKCTTLSALQLFFITYTINRQHWKYTYIYQKATSRNELKLNFGAHHTQQLCILFTFSLVVGGVVYVFQFICVILLQLSACVYVLKSIKLHGWMG